MKTVCKLLLLTVTSLVSSGLFAQNEQDVIRYSQPMLNGSARFIGFGGAFAALGGDFSAIGLNPAGTAVFLNNELSFSLGTNTTSRSALYLGRNTENFDGRIVIPSAGILGSHIPKQGNWKAVNFAFTYNRLKDYNQTTSIRGATDNNSLADFFADEASGISEDQLAEALPFSAGLAYNAYLIDPDTLTADNTDYKSALRGLNVEQNFKTESEGRLGESLLALGANYNNKFYIGAALGIRSIRFNQYERLSERNELKDPDLLENYDYNYNLSANGSGYNLRIGAIYRISEGLRVGVNLQTPTLYSINEEYSSSLTTNFNDGQSYREESPIGNFSYYLYTPGKIGMGAAYVFGKKGVISVDYDRMDFGKSRFISTNSDGQDIDFSSDNENLQQLLTEANNIRIGTEWRVNAVSLRAGYGLSQNAYARQNREFATDISTVSFGIGYRIKAFSADFGMAYSSFTNDYLPYRGASTAKVDNGHLSTAISFGVRF